MKISKGINIFHSFLTGYISLGWALPGEVNSKILTALIPGMYANWLLDDKKCIFTRLEKHFIEKENNKDDKKEKIINNDGFIMTKLKEYNIEVKVEDVDKISVIIAFHTFLQSYYYIISQ
jgi:hypothetical protein